MLRSENHMVIVLVCLESTQLLVDGSLHEISAHLDVSHG